MEWVHCSCTVCKMKCTVLYVLVDLFHWTLLAWFLYVEDCLMYKFLERAFGVANFWRKVLLWTFKQAKVLPIAVFCCVVYVCLFVCSFCCVYLAFKIEEYNVSIDQFIHILVPELREHVAELVLSHEVSQRSANALFGVGYVLNLWVWFRLSAAHT